MNNNKDLADKTKCLRYMIGKYNLTAKEWQAVDYVFRLFIEKRLSGFELIGLRRKTSIFRYGDIRRFCLH